MKDTQEIANAESAETRDEQERQLHVAQLWAAGWLIASNIPLLGTYRRPGDNRVSFIFLNDGNRAANALTDYYSGRAALSDARALVRGVKRARSLIWSYASKSVEPAR